MTYVSMVTPAAQTNVTGPRITWGTTETVILQAAVNRTGYWWAACGLLIFSGSSDLQTARLKINGGLIASATLYAIQWWGIPLLATSQPVLISNGQLIQLTMQAQTYPANNAETGTQLSYGFVPTPAYPK